MTLVQHNVTRKFIAVAILIAACFFGAARAIERPNIVFIFADDLGWGDLGSYGHPVIKTPFLDKMAEDGLLLTNFYVASPVCSPSRTAVMTGQYPARHEIHQHFASHEINVSRNMPDFLDPKVTLLTRLLQQNGYKTGHFGKWHLGPGRDELSPSAYGIDVHNIRLGVPRHQSTQMMVDEAIRFIEENREAPFYINLWTLVPHATLDTTDKQMAPYESVAPIGAANERRFSSPAQIYYGAVTDLDYHVGRLIRKIDDLGIGDNTVIVFSSDNGPEDIHIRNTTHSGVGSAGPFRGRKRSLYEGGIRVPFIIRWTGQTPAGQVDDESIVSAVDLLPSFLKLADIEMPSDYQSDGQDTSDIFFGKPVRRDKPLLWDWTGFQMGPGGHVSNMSPGLALRSGKWKFLMNPDGTRKELYDFEVDPQSMEVDNVANQHPDLVRRFSKTLLDFKASIPQAIPSDRAGSNAYPMPGHR